MAHGTGEQGAGRVRGGRDDELPEPEGCAGGDARAAQRRAEVDGLQQVKHRSLLGPGRLLLPHFSSASLL